MKLPEKCRMQVVAPSWKQHLLQRELDGKNEKDVLFKLRSLQVDPETSGKMDPSFCGEEVKFSIKESRTGDCHRVMSINTLLPQ